MSRVRGPAVATTSVADAVRGHARTGEAFIIQRAMCFRVDRTQVQLAEKLVERAAFTLHGGEQRQLGSGADIGHVLVPLDDPPQCHSAPSPQTRAIVWNSSRTIPTRAFRCAATRSMVSSTRARVRALYPRGHRCVPRGSGSAVSGGDGIEREAHLERGIALRTRRSTSCHRRPMARLAPLQDRLAMSVDGGGAGEISRNADALPRR